MAATTESAALVESTAPHFQGESTGFTESSALTESTAVDASDVAKAAEKRRIVERTGDAMREHGSAEVVIDDDELHYDEAGHAIAEDEIVAGSEHVDSTNQYARRGGHNVSHGSALGSFTTITIHQVPDEKTMELPGHSGWVRKASGSWLVGWQWRWVVLEDRHLRWYLSPEKAEAHETLGTLDFDLVHCEVERTWTKGQAQSQMSSSPASLQCCVGRRGPQAVFRVCPSYSNRAFELSATSVSEGDRWVDSIIGHIHNADQRSEGVPHPPPAKLGGTTAWWKVQRISPEKFEQIAETGDILLFRSTGSMPAIIRAASSGGRYDHVALVLKLAGGEVGLLEATGGEGVGLCVWNNFLENGWHKLYPELALRRVRCQRTAERLQKLQDWASQVIGKPYGISVGKLMKRGSLTGEEQHENFFCSELCAEALKVFEVIPRGKSSGQYWPSTFSAKCGGKIECLPGSRFDGEDLIIDFSLSSEEYEVDGPKAERDCTIKV